MLRFRAQTLLTVFSIGASIIGASVVFVLSVFVLPGAPANDQLQFVLRLPLRLTMIEVYLWLLATVLFTCWP